MLSFLNEMDSGVVFFAFRSFHRPYHHHGTSVARHQILETMASFGVSTAFLVVLCLVNVFVYFGHERTPRDLVTDGGRHH